jgi:hypothetical protein
MIAKSFINKENQVALDGERTKIQEKFKKK